MKASFEKKKFYQSLKSNLKVEFFEYQKINNFESLNDKLNYKLYTNMLVTLFNNEIKLKKNQLDFLKMSLKSIKN